jgi:hypothetical protein
MEGPGTRQASKRAAMAGWQQPASRTRRRREQARHFFVLKEGKASFGCSRNTKGFSCSEKKGKRKGARIPTTATESHAPVVLYEWNG